MKIECQKKWNRLFGSLPVLIAILGHILLIAFLLHSQPEKVRSTQSNLPKPVQVSIITENPAYPEASTVPAMPLEHQLSSSPARKTEVVSKKVIAVPVNTPEKASTSPSEESPQALPVSDVGVGGEKEVAGGEVAAKHSQEGFALAEQSQPRFNAAYLHNPKPSYPPIARRRGIEGKVILKVWVSVDGSATSVEIHRSSSNTSLDDSAINAVKRWRFEPAKQGGTPVAASVLVPIIFKLEG